MTSLFKILEDRGILAPLETEVLMDMAMCLKRQDLIDLVAQYQGILILILQSFIMFMCVLL